MKTTYLLPCAACDEKFQVEASDSGTTLTCACGAKVEVPALRRLTHLPKVMLEEPALAPSAWGGRQRGLAAGGVIALVGLSVGLFWTIRTVPTVWDVFDTQERNKLRIDERGLLDKVETPVQALELWFDTERSGPVSAPPKEMEKYHGERRLHVWWRVTGFAVAALGGIIMLATWLIHQARTRRLAARQPLVKQAVK